VSKPLYVPPDSQEFTSLRTHYGHSKSPSWFLHPFEHANICVFYWLYPREFEIYLCVIAEKDLAQGLWRVRPLTFTGFAQSKFSHFFPTLLSLSVATHFDCISVCQSVPIVAKRKLWPSNFGWERNAVARVWKSRSRQLFVKMFNLKNNLK